MKYNKLIQVYEHSYLNCYKADKENIFKKHHFNQLVKYNELMGNKFFHVGYKKIKFKQYVGVIQVNDLIIEVLPKVDKNKEDKALCRSVLIEMLKVCGYIKIDSISNAKLNIKKHTLLNYYIEYFLNEVEKLIYQGMVKKYRKKEMNSSFVKGKILFNQHIIRNQIHKEKFYIKSSIYDYNNVYNQILKKALLCLNNILFNESITKRISNALLHLESVKCSSINKKTFKTLQFDRNTIRYYNAVQLAELIILNYSPDIKFGENKIISILFDMNKLFEEYIFIMLRNEKKNYPKLKIKYQEGKRFWESKLIRTDITLKLDKSIYILDTKWKVSDMIPSDQDLKQMYIYNLFWNSHDAVLLYPSISKEQNKSYKGTYRNAEGIPDYKGSLQMIYVELLKNDKLNKNIGSEIISEILE